VPKRSLGRGIDALIAGSEEALEGASVTTVPLQSISAGGQQPRKRFSEEALEELARSIEQKGVLQPLLVEEGEPGRYTIVAGERRFRAARKAGLTQIPVIVRRFTELEKTEIALIENLQREDLTPVEEARGYKTLIDRGGLTQEEVARRVGKDRSTVANSLRLLKLAPEFLEALDQSRLSAGHARALLSVSDPVRQEVLFRRIVEQGLSVREAEDTAGRLNQERSADGGNRAAGGVPGRAPAGRKPRPANLDEVERRFIERLGTKVVIRGSEHKGRIEISYFSMDDLDRILEIVDGD
jgi:ParB family chromosome partitioning protein